MKYICKVRCAWPMLGLGQSVLALDGRGKCWEGDKAATSFLVGCLAIVLMSLCDAGDRSVERADGDENGARNVRAQKIEDTPIRPLNKRA